MIFVCIELGVGCVIEQDSGFTMKHPVSKHAYPNHLEKRQTFRLFKTHAHAHSPAELEPIRPEGTHRPKGACVQHHETVIPTSRKHIMRMIRTEVHTGDTCRMHTRQVYKR